MILPEKYAILFLDIEILILYKEFLFLKGEIKMGRKLIDDIQDGYTLEQEKFAFAFLTGRMGEDFLKTPRRKRKVEDYAKLLSISIVFQLKRVFLKLVREGESRIDEIFDYLNKEGKKFEVVESWIMEAIEKIPDEKLKTAGLGVWNELKKRCDRQNFNIRDLL